jgi:hypothetical protein
LIRERDASDFYSGNVFNTAQAVAPSAGIAAGACNSKLLNKRFKRHFSEQSSEPTVLRPMFDANADGALILYDAGSSSCDAAYVQSVLLVPLHMYA